MTRYPLPLELQDRSYSPPGRGLPLPQLEKKTKMLRREKNRGAFVFLK